MRLLAPLRHRDFRLLWIGMTVSLIGDGIFLVAIAWQAYELSDSPAALSLVGVAMTIPHVAFLLIGGVVSDRFDRRRVMISADVVRGVALACLGVLSSAGIVELWHMMLIAAVYGGGTAFFGPAFDAIVPDLVPAAELTQANSLDQFVRPAAIGLAGPALGGVLIAVGGTGGAFLLDAVTFAVSIVAVSMMRPLPAAERRDEPRAASALREVREGYRYVRSNVWLWGTFLAATFAYLLFMGPSDVLLPYMVKNELHGSPSDLGLILAAGGVGAIFAAIVVAHRGAPRRHMTFIYVVWTLSTFAIAGYGLARAQWQIAVACFAFNGLEAAGTIVWATTKQRFVPRRLLGRVSSFDWFISTGLLPVSYALSGPVAGWFGARATLIGAGIAGGIVTFAFLFLPGMRDTERNQTDPVEGSPAPMSPRSLAETG
jgi:MFS family permease